MSTATLTAPTPVDVLNHKKRFAEALSSRDAARTAADTAIAKVRSVGRSARETAMAIFRALHLDALAGSAGNAVRGLFGRGWALLGQAWDFIGRTFGWKMVGAYVLTDERARNAVLDTAARTYLVATGSLIKAAGWLSMVPLIGKPVVALLTIPAQLVDRAVAKGFSLAANAGDRYGDSSFARGVHGAAQFLLFRSALTRFVPAGLRLPLIIAYGVRHLFAPAQAAIEAVKADPAAAAVGAQVTRVKDVAKAAAATATDVVVDRVLEGKVQTTQPSSESLEIIEVATGKRHTVVVEVDTRGEKRIFWDGMYYDVEGLGEAEKDPVRPIPVDLTTLAMRADQARKAAEEVMPPAPNLATTQAPRDVARALGPKSKKSTGRARTPSSR